MHPQFTLLLEEARVTRGRAVGLGLLGWTLVAVMFSFEGQLRPADLDPSHSWAHGLAWRLVGWWSWAAFTPLVCWVAARLRRYKVWITVAAHVAAGTAIAILCAVLQGFLRWLVGLYHPSRGLAEGIAMVIRAYWPFNVVVYVTVLGLYLAITYAREAQRRDLHATRLETQLVQARLDVLTARLQPHFLFNTLHAISALVLEDAQSANRMIARLSELLRLSLSRSGTPLVSLEQELELLSRYVSIQELRFSDQLRVHLLIEPGTLGARVPSLLLQPIVENAIRHSIAAGHATAEVDVRSSRGDGLLRIEVSDNGPGFGGTMPPAEGEGLRNTRERLSQLYGDRHRLQLADRVGGGAVVTIELPFEDARARVDR
jgi:two-component system, LytTR family, sensor kinase